MPRTTTIFSSLETRLVKEPLSSDDKLTVCECPVSYHEVVMPDGNRVAVLDEGMELPDLMTLCVGRCTRCGLPFQNDFTSEEIQ